MQIRVVKKPINQEELKRIAQERYGDLVKAVVDVEQGIMALGGEMHADEEVVLIEQEGSQREYTWGFNLWVDKTGEDFLEFDSLVNIKPSFGNRIRGIENADIRQKIRDIVAKLIIT